MVASGEGTERWSGGGEEMPFFILCFVVFGTFKKYCSYINAIDIKENVITRKGVGALQGSIIFYLGTQMYSLVSK